MTRLAWISVLVLALSACDDDGDGSSGSDSSTSAGPGDSSTSAGGSTTSVDPSTTGGPVGSSSGEPGSSSGAAGSSSGGDSSSSGNPNACDPVIPGSWNACVDENGNVDNTQCEWMGVGGATGFIGCLTSSMTEGANVCMISDCEDTCDCFAPPATGNAVVACAEVLEGGGRACVLQCAGGETCPDGMSCEGGICFHSPA